MATQQRRGERERPITVPGLTTPWAVAETVEIAVVADITLLLLLLTILLTVEEAVEGLAVLLQPVEEDVAQQVRDVAPARAVEHAAINHANTPSTTTSTPWRTITSKNYN